MTWIFPPEELARLVRPQRFRRCPPFKTLRMMGLKRGMDVADIGCGPGFWTLPAARITGPAARVYACDISPRMLAAARQRASADGRTNITIKRSRTYQVPFAPACTDFCMMNYVLHEVDDPPRLLAEGARVLRRGGVLAVYEWAAVKTEIGPPLSERIGQAKMKTFFRAAGLRPAGSSRPDRANYIVLGVRK